MLLVHDHEPHVGEWRKERRARAHNHVGVALARHVPLVEALAHREARVQNGHVVAEAAAKAPHRLRRERDLGHNHDGPAPLCSHAFDGVEVDLRLARARDAVDKHHVTLCGVRGARDGGEGLLLPRREALRPRGPGARERGGTVDRPAHATAVVHVHHATLEQRRHHTGRTGYERRELRHALRARDEGLEHATLAARVGAWLIRAALLRERDPSVVDSLGLLDHEMPGATVLARDAHGLPGRGHEAQTARERGRVLTGDPAGEPRPHLVEGGAAQHGLHGQHARGVDPLARLAANAYDVAHHVPVPKAHEHSHAHPARACERVGDGVVEAPVDGAGGYVGDNLCVAHAHQCS